MQAERSGNTARDAEQARFANEGGGTAVDGEEAHHGGSVEVHKTGRPSNFAMARSSLPPSPHAPTRPTRPSCLARAACQARTRAWLNVKPWVKTSLAPGSKVVTEYLEQGRSMKELEALGFHLVGYGCTTCIGNSGPLPDHIRDGIREGELVVCSVLSGNRNFEGRIHAEVKMNFLASPPLVVAYAIAGRMDIDLYAEPLGTDSSGEPVFLKDIWPSAHAVHDAIGSTISSDMFRASYANVFAGDERWNAIDSPEGEQYAWAGDSTYIKHPPYFVGMSKDAGDITPIQGARVLALLGDSITTDHISPAGRHQTRQPGRQISHRARCASRATSTLLAPDAVTTKS